MIIGFFLTSLYVLIAFFVGLLPEFTLPQGWIDGVALVWGYLNSFKWLLPISELVSVLTIVLAFHVTLLLYDISLLVYRLLRGF